MPLDPNRNLITEVCWQPRNSWQAVNLLHRVAAEAADCEGFTHGRLSIAVVGATAMATLHKRYLGKSGPTDVLSFDLDTDRGQGHLEGEVVVCTDVARRRAARYGRALQAARAELALYVVHGILHLAGYDDHTPADNQKMHRREDEILCRLGLGPVFRLGVQSIRSGC
jgi:probable rRNA maturation factor